MKDLVEFELNGEKVFVEVEGQQSSDFLDEGFRGESFEQGNRKFLDAVKSVKPAAEAILEIFKGVQGPDEIGLEFGLKFNAKVGVVLASADSEATFKLSLKWTDSKKG